MILRLIVYLLVINVTLTYGQYITDTVLGDDDPELSPSEIVEPGCPIIQNLHNITFKSILGQWHLPYMSSHWIHSMAKSMHAKIIKRSYMGKLCIKVNAKELPPGGTPNNTEATLWLQSKCPHTGAEWSIACAPDEVLNSKWYCNDLKGRTHEGDSHVFVVDSDGKTWALIVRCFPNNEMNWAIFSKIKRLDDALVKTLLGKVELMGFKLFNVIEVPFEKCMTKPQ